MKIIKRFITPIFMMMILLLGCKSSYDFTNKFTVLPENPKAGSEITVLFNAAGTALENATELNMVIYNYGTELYNTDEYAMTKEGQGWVGKFTCPDSAFGFMVKFVSDDKTDNNAGKGYIQYLFGNDGKELPGAAAGFASALVSWVDYLEIDRDPEKAFGIFENAFKTHPELKSDYMANYIYSLNYTKGETAREEIFAMLTELEGKKDIQEKDLKILYNWNNRLGRPDKAMSVKSMLIEKYPKSEIIQNEKYREFYQAATVDEKIAAAESFIAEFDGGEIADYMKNSLISLLCNQNQFDKAFAMIDKFGDKVSSGIYNSVAYSMLENNIDLEKAEQYAKKGADAARKEIDNPTEEKPKEISKSEWKKQKQNSLAYILDTYGQIQSKLGRNEEALVTLKEANNITKGKEADLNKTYVNLLVTLGKTADAKKQIESYISEGYASAELKEILKKIYTDEKGSADGFDQYMSKFESEAETKMKEELKNKMINEPAPEFSLNNLEGAAVTSAELKGKVVILDFWATWCGPCKASFPGMKQVVEKYMPNKDVKIFFVNTFERVDDKLKNAKDFITQNNYPFDVLMDTDNAASKIFKVTAIPTKVILDASGNIRFKSIGYNGDNDALVKEIDMMISMIK